MLFAKKKPKVIPAKLTKETAMTDSELMKTMGSGNSQVRYIPDEFVQSRILREGGKS